ncbi:MAG: hypothetical protein JOZ17_13695 [Acetobacteraceae bacterium]|nr:hypothetical protein [Acetobacteraceae bacterium]
MLERDLLADAGPSVPAGQTQRWADRADLDLCQLRHQTKNALERINAIVWTVPGLKSSVAGRQLAREVERRIGLAAQISDALFGFTRSPAPMEERLRSLAEALVALYSDRDQMIQIEVAYAGSCPAALHDVVLRTAHELVANAIKHGFYARLIGCIRLELTSDQQGVRLVVADDGWGLGHRSGTGQGLRLVRALIEPFGGTLELQTRDGVTARLHLLAGTSVARIGEHRNAR